MLFRTVRARWSVTVSLLFFVLMTGAGLAHAALPYAPGQTLDPTCHPGEPNCTVQVFTAAGDLRGSSTYQTVVGLQGNPIASTTPTSSQVLQWNGSAWAPATLNTSTSTNYWSPTSSGIYYNASGSVAVGTTVPAGAPAGSVAAGGAIYSGSPQIRPAGSRSLFVGQGLGVSYAFGMAQYEPDNPELPIPVTPSTFNPTALNIDQWLDTAVLGGAQFVLLTTKHWDGFALWPTAYAYPYAISSTDRVPYSVAQSSWYTSVGPANGDIVGSFVRKARARNLNVVLYYSIRDGQFQARTGWTAADHPAEYIAMIEQQLQELLTNYGPIDAIVTDSWGWVTEMGGGNPASYTYIPYATIHDFIKSLQPNTLLIENNHLHPASSTELELYESTVDAGRPPLGNTRLSLYWPTIAAGEKWFYDATCTNYSVWKLGMDMYQSRANAYAVVPNFGPDPTGNLTACQRTAFLQAVNIRTTGGPSLGKAVTVSSIYPDSSCTASALTDGVYHQPATGTDGIWCANMTSLTPWAEVDLGAATAIGGVDLFPRTGVAVGRFRDLVVTIYDTSHTLIYTSAVLNPANVLGGGVGDYSNGPNYLSLPLSITGRYVRVTRQGTALTEDGSGLDMAEIGVLPQIP